MRVRVRERYSERVSVRVRVRVRYVEETRVMFHVSPLVRYVSVST